MLRFAAIVPAHNPDPDELERCLRAIRGQLDPALHHLCVLDDASADADVCAAAAARHGFALVRRGPEDELGNRRVHAFACRLAVHSGAELTHFCHPDDWVLPNFYAAVAGAAAQAPGRALYATSHLECDHAGRPFDAPKITGWLGANGRTFLPIHQGNPLAVAACCVRTKFYAEHGGWDERLLHTSDWLAFLMATTYGGAAHVDWPLACYTHGKANHTRRTMRSADNLRDYLAFADIAAGHVPVDRAAFRAYVAARARRQAAFFAQAGDADAAAANELFAEELEGD